MTTREEILANLDAVIGGIPSVGTVVVGKIDPVDRIEALTLPCAWVFPGDERMTESTASMETWEWSVEIEVWAKDSDLEPLLGAIHAALAADATRGGFALNCYRDGSRFFAVDPARSIGAMQLSYRILYRHPFGQP